MKTFTAYVEWDPETKMYIGIVPGIQGAHTQAASLDELNQNLKEVIALCLQENPEMLTDLPHFVGIQQVEVSL
jgi:predicted RNase H-like HicB family nuclease